MDMPVAEGDIHRTLLADAVAALISILTVFAGMVPEKIAMDVVFVERSIISIKDSYAFPDSVNDGIRFCPLVFYLPQGFSEGVLPLFFC